MFTDLADLWERAATDKTPLRDIGVALLMGFRTRSPVDAWLTVADILTLSTLALTWIAVITGPSAKTVDGASAFSYPLIFLPFISSAFVPTDSMLAP